MNEAIRCAQCGVTNPPDALFCERCGASISDVTRDASLRSSEPPASQSRRRFNRRYAVYAVVGVIVAASIASLPWIWPQSDFTSQINDYFPKVGFTIDKPFQRTTLDGADAYVGSVIYVGNVSHISRLTDIEVFPRDSDIAAQSFEQTLAHQFWSQGFIETSSMPGSSWSVFETISTPGSSWFGTSNDSRVGIAVVSGNNSPTGAPAVLVEQTTLPNSTTTPVSTTSSPSASVQQSSSRTANVTMAKLAAILWPELNTDVWQLSAGMHTQCFAISDGGMV